MFNMNITQNLWKSIMGFKTLGWYCENIYGKKKNKTLENEYLLTLWGKNRIMTAVPANIVCKWFHVISYKHFSNAQWKRIYLQCGRYRRHWFHPMVKKIIWRRKWQPTPVFLLKSPKDRGAWEATVQRATKSWTQLSDWAQFHITV